MKTVQRIEEMSAGVNEALAAYNKAKLEYDFKKTQLALVTFMADEAIVTHADSWIAFCASHGTEVPKVYKAFDDFLIEKVLGFTTLEFAPLRYMKSRILHAKASSENEQLPAWSKKGRELAKEYENLYLAMYQPNTPEVETETEPASSFYVAVDNAGPESSVPEAVTEQPAADATQVEKQAKPGKKGNKAGQAEPAQEVQE